MTKKIWRWFRLQCFRRKGVFNVGLELDVTPEDLERARYARLGRSRRVADVAEREENKAHVERILERKKDDC